VVAAQAVRGAGAAVLFAGTLPCPARRARHGRRSCFGGTCRRGHTGHVFFQIAAVNRLVSKVALTG
jgi:hypothetical protein